MKKMITFSFAAFLVAANLFAGSASAQNTNYAESTESRGILMIFSTVRMA